MPTQTDDAPLTREAVESLSVETLEQRREETVARAEQLAEQANENGGLSSREDRQAMRTALDDIGLLTEVIAERQGDEGMLEEIRQARAAADEAAQRRRETARPPVHGARAGGNGQRQMTPGEAFTDSQAYRTWMQRYPDGAPSSGGGSVESDAVIIDDMAARLGMRTAGRAPALVTAADASAGELVRPQYMGLLEPGLVRPVVLRELVTVIPTTSDAIEYVREESRERAAAPVAEAEATGGATGTKPEGGLTFTLVTDTIKTIAVWVAATKRIISDAPGLRAYIDNYLIDDLGQELEDQIAAGDGLGENFLGILNTPGIQTVGPWEAPASQFDNIRRAKTLIRTNARTRANAVALNPEDSEAIDLLKVNNEANHYVGAGPFQAAEGSPLWGLRRVECEAIPVGTGLVGDFSKALYFDRQTSTISVGTVNDDFIRNIVRVLAELRGGFGVSRAAAFVAVDLTELVSP